MSGQYVYVEQGVQGHPRTASFLARLPRAQVIACDHYGEVFNRRAQDFRLQKRSPAWIVAAKNAGWVLEAPAGYGVGGDENYYFSHMLNCIYDCGYCFLQGMFRSAHYLWFVNYENFMGAIDERLAASRSEAVWFFSGYDCDSLAAEPVTHFASEFLPFFAARPRAWLEVRTKSVQIDALLEHEPVPNCVVAFSFTPAEVHGDLERGVPTVDRRIEAMKRLAARGWTLGLRFDPLIWSRDHRERHARLFDQVFGAIPLASIHSASLGVFRLPRSFYARMRKMSPLDPLLAGPLVDTEGLMSYRPDLEEELVEGVSELLLERLPASRFFPCRSATPQRSAITFPQ